MFSRILPPSWTGGCSVAIFDFNYKIQAWNGHLVAMAVSCVVMLINAILSSRETLGKVSILP